MESLGTVLQAATTAPLASGPRERVYGPSVPNPSSAGDADGQSSETRFSPSTAVLQLVLWVVEQFQTTAAPGQAAQEAATTTGFDIGREHGPDTDVARGLDLYA